MFHHCGYICLVLQVLFVVRIGWWLLMRIAGRPAPRAPKVKSQ